jgi:hypothetical protein
MADRHPPSGDKTELGSVDTEWGRQPQDHFGYASEEERLAKRGLEDWELVDKIPESQKNIPVWFIAVILVVLLVAVGLSFPFWGDRPGYERSWFNWGFVIALVYIAVAAAFVYFMVRLYGSHAGGRLDSDKDREHGSAQDHEQPRHDKDRGH